MRKIANTHELQTELHGLLAYAQDPLPSRAVLASKLQELSDRVAVEFPTERALKKYLEKHPDADPSKHHVNAPAYHPDRKKRDDLTKNTDDELAAKARQPMLKSRKKEIQEEIKKRTDAGKYKPTELKNRHNINVFKHKLAHALEVLSSGVAGDVRSARVAQRYAMEHATPEAMKAYLQEHPNADAKNHQVKEQKDKPSKQEDSNPFRGDIKLIRQTNKAPQESLKALKIIDRLERKRSLSLDEKQKLKDTRKQLLSGAQELQKSVEAFFDSRKDAKPQAPHQVAALRSAEQGRARLTKAIKTFIGAGDHPFIHDVEDLHAAILDVSGSTGLLIKGD